MAVAEGVFALPFVTTMFYCVGDCGSWSESWTSVLSLDRAVDLLLLAPVMVLVAIPAAFPPWLLALAMSAAWVRVRGPGLVEPSHHPSDPMPIGGGGGGADFDQTIA